MAGTFPSRAEDGSVDWAQQLRALAASNRLEEASRVVKKWMEAYPNDLDAHGWNARLLSWMNRWSEAEVEYRELIRLAPEDIDLQMGLADVLNWQGKPSEALAVLDEACRTTPARPDCHLRQARTLQNLGRRREARQVYRQILAFGTSSAEAQEAKAGLEQSRELARHEVRVGTDQDLLNFAQNGNALTASLRSRLTSRVHSGISLTQYERFGEPATRFGAESTFRFSRSASLTTGGAVASNQGIVPRSEAFFELGRGFRIHHLGPFRGMELTYRQRWLWYQNARVLAFSPGTILYLPKDWHWLFSVSASRSYLSGSGIEWQPAGWTKLSFPLHRSVRSHLLFGSGTENFGLLDQIGRFSARTWGSGFSFRLPSGHEFNTYGSFQSRSQSRSQTSFGVSYAVRF